MSISYSYKGIGLEKTMESIVSFIKAGKNIIPLDVVIQFISDDVWQATLYYRLAEGARPEPIKYPATVRKE